MWDTILCPTFYTVLYWVAYVIEMYVREDCFAPIPFSKLSFLAMKDHPR